MRLLLAAALAALAALPPPAASAPLPVEGLALARRVPPSSVHTVHLAMSHHLDVGLDLPNKLTADCVGFATKIVQRYFDVFIPRILRLADEAEAARPPVP
eukprot:COSAG06_NODE_384_length_16504_cov_9.943005_10_plen_99_part_01